MNNYPVQFFAFSFFSSLRSMHITISMFILNVLQMFSEKKKRRNTVVPGIKVIKVGFLLVCVHFLFFFLNIVKRRKEEIVSSSFFKLSG